MLCNVQDVIIDKNSKNAILPYVKIMFNQNIDKAMNQTVCYFASILS